MIYIAHFRAHHTRMLSLLKSEQSKINQDSVTRTFLSKEFSLHTINTGIFCWRYLFKWVVAIGIDRYGDACSAGNLYDDTSCSDVLDALERDVQCGYDAIHIHVRLTGTIQSCVGAGAGWWRHFDVSAWGIHIKSITRTCQGKSNPLSNVLTF